MPLQHRSGISAPIISDVTQEQWHCKQTVDSIWIRAKCQIPHACLCCSNSSLLNEINMTWLCIWLWGIISSFGEYGIWLVIHNWRKRLFRRHSCISSMGETWDSSLFISLHFKENEVQRPFPYWAASSSHLNCPGYSTIPIVYTMRLTW